MYEYQSNYCSTQVGQELNPLLFGRSTYLDLKTSSQMQSTKGSFRYTGASPSAGNILWLGRRMMSFMHCCKLRSSSK